MSTSAHIAKHMEEVFFGGNWTVSNLKDQLADVTWEKAQTQVHDLNTIAILTNHIGYYVRVVSKVLKGLPLEGKDELSFDHPPIKSQQDWVDMQNELWTEVREFVKLIEEIPDDRLWEDFMDGKYGIYYRNLHGIIEHTHYHLGQVALVKKVIRKGQPN